MNDPTTGPGGAPHPFGQFDVQLPGRLFAVEALLMVLLAEKTTARRVIARAEAYLSQQEAAAHAGGLGQEDDYALKLFAAARESLDGFAHRLGRS